MVIVSVMIAAACSPGEGPESIPLPTSPDTTTSTTSTTSTTTTTTPATTTTTVVPPTFQATIRRTTDGVPHVLADDRKGLMFGQGWVSAEDSGCILIDQVLKIRGERSANLGPGENGENVESDFAWRSIDIMERATEDYDTASGEIVELFAAFANGWNSFLEQAGEDGLSGWCSGAEWVRPVQPVEIYAYARSVALLASGSQLAQYIPAAQPPPPGTPPPPPADEPTEDAAEALAPAEESGSNAWAVGSDRTEGGEGGLLVANPHFPWEGELRFAEIHLTVPDDIDIYGAQLSGLPGVGIGFTEEVAWSQTVSAGKRFTAYLLTLDPASPTTYLVDGEPRKMTSEDHDVEILRPDGSVDTETRTLWHTEYGPVIDFPGIGWTTASTLTYRDANIDNDEFVAQYLDMIDVAGLDDLIATHERHQGVPLFNTIATGSDGRVWYADTSASPNLSPAAETLFLERLETDPVTKIAWDSGVMLLDGSNSVFVWQKKRGARDPGLVPWDEFPMVERTDYVFNANDSYWVPSAEFTLDGNYSIVHGEQDTPRSMRTRQNAEVLRDGDPLGLAGNDGDFSGIELREAVFDNTSHNALLLKDSAVAACRTIPVVPVGPLTDSDGIEILPAAGIDVSDACDVLAAWNGRYDLDQSGPLLWRETMSQFDGDDRTMTGSLFEDPFDPENPTQTPASPNSDPLPLLGAFARAVQIIEASGFAVDSTLGAAQFTERSDERIALHGGTGTDGVTNVVVWSSALGSSSEPQPERGDPVAPDSNLTGSGYPVNAGTSFVMTVDYTEGTPRAWAILTYGQTIDRESDLFDQQTVRFSDKNWRNVAFTEEDILADPEFTERVVSAD
jgi:acyl-homoserine-lactone acylase